MKMYKFNPMFYDFGDFIANENIIINKKWNYTKRVIDKYGLEVPDSDKIERINKMIQTPVYDAEYVRHYADRYSLPDKFVEFNTTFGKVIISDYHAPTEKALKEKKFLPYVMSAPNGARLIVFKRKRNIEPWLLAVAECRQLKNED